MPTKDKEFRIQLSLSQWIQVVTFLATIVKAIAEMVKEMEKSEGDGPSKKAAVMAFIQTLIEESLEYVPSLAGLKDAILTIAGPIISAIVAAYNAIGAFAHKPK